MPGESQGQGSLVGCRLWGRRESGTTEATLLQQQTLWGLQSEIIFIIKQKHYWPSLSLLSLDHTMEFSKDHMTVTLMVDLL